MTSAKERRKRQNRLNQRAYREFIPVIQVFPQTICECNQPSHPDHCYHSLGVFDCLSPLTNCGKLGRRKAQLAGVQEQITGLPYRVKPHDQSLQTRATPRPKPLPTLPSTSAANGKDEVGRQTYRNIGEYHGTTSFYFPLPKDQALLHVIAFNVSRAVLTNYDILSPSQQFFPTSYSCCSNTVSPPKELSAWAPVIPKSLEPTILQLRVPHPRWIDLFPSPKLRNNIILAISEARLDPEELANDLVGALFDAMDCGGSHSQLDEENPSVDPRLMSADCSHSTSSESEELGLVAWSDPWDIVGWEFTEEFARKWSFLLKDCPEVVVATNGWRTARGEESLVIET